MRQLCWLNRAQPTYMRTLRLEKQDLYAHNGSLHFRQPSKSPERLQCGDAVSYTHLDVYKRQGK